MTFTMTTDETLRVLETLAALDDVTNVYELADRLGVHDRRADDRVRPMRAAGLIDVDRGSNKGTLGTIRTTNAGRAVRDMMLDSLAGVVPPLHPDIERASLTWSALHLYGTETHHVHE